MEEQKNSVNPSDSESDVFSQSSEPDSDREISSSPNEYISSPETSDVYTGQDNLADVDRDENVLIYTQDSSDEHWDESDEDYEGQHNNNNPRAKSFVRWLVALILAFQAAYAIPYTATHSHFFILCLLYCIQFVRHHSFMPL